MFDKKWEPIQPFIEDVILTESVVFLEESKATEDISKYQISIKIPRYEIRPTFESAQDYTKCISAIFE